MIHQSPEYASHSEGETVESFHLSPENFEFIIYIWTNMAVKGKAHLYEY